MPDVLRAGGVAPDDRGSVAVEALLVAPALVAVALAVLAVLQPVAALLAAEEAARAGARAVAVTGDDAAARTAVARTVPDGSVAVERGDGLVVVVVRAPGRVLGRASDVEARAVAALEPQP